MIPSRSAPITTDRRKSRNMKSFVRRLIGTALIALTVSVSSLASAQTGPSQHEVDTYTGLHKAAHFGDLGELKKLIKAGASLEEKDSRGRTPLHVAVFASNDEAVKLLAGAGADLNAFENDRFDIVTIAAVANDTALLKTLLSLGASPSNITSRYDGTALIWAAHLGHHEIVKQLIDAGAPLDHVNNLGWTALIEAVILGDGGADHVTIIRHLLKAGADKTITDRQGVSPLQHAKQRAYSDMVDLLNGNS